jgi:hypothetical protein
MLPEPASSKADKVPRHLEKRNENFRFNVMDMHYPKKY